MKKIGITGGIGAGKSLVCHIFEIFGIPNYPADARAKWLQQNDPTLKGQIISLLGENAYSKNGALNREFIAQVVFSDKAKLADLNKLVHPAVANDFEQWCQQHKDKRFILKEAALLFETGSYKNLDATIMVHADEELRLERTLTRDSQRSTEDIKKIMRQQMAEEEKIQLADYLINNDGKSSLIQQCLTLFQKLSPPSA